MSNLLQKLRLRTGEAIGAEGRIVPIDAEGLIVPIDIVNEVVLAIRRLRGVNIGLETDGRTATVAMDPAAFRSVILHLSENAIEASDEVKVRVHHQQMRVQIEVADNGPGMSPEFIRDTLFQPFGSTKEGGFGIGAYQARELIRAAGGDLVVASRHGQGTRMSILLPSTTSRLVGSSGIGNLEAAG
jgi:signal transduction histidine kinase